MAFVLDTNVISELRKGQRCLPSVRRWYESTAVEDIFMSVLVLGEMRHGVELKRRNDPETAHHFERWLREVKVVYKDRILPVTAEICDVWGRIAGATRLPTIDGLIAATALYHDLTVVTRNTADFQRSGVDYLNPFTG